MGENMKDNRPLVFIFTGTIKPSDLTEWYLKLLEKSKTANPNEPLRYNDYTLHNKIGEDSHQPAKKPA
jgi:hypothetical protein